MVGIPGGSLPLLGLRTGANPSHAVFRNLYSVIHRCPFEQVPGLFFANLWRLAAHFLLAVTSSLPEVEAAPPCPLLPSFNTPPTPPGGWPRPLLFCQRQLPGLAQHSEQSLRGQGLQLSENELCELVLMEARSKDMSPAALPGPAPDIRDMPGDQRL